MTEDHGLSDGDNSIECAQSYEFILLPLTVNKELWGRERVRGERDGYTDRLYCILTLQF